MQQLKNAVALISGAASGIGAAVATRIANSGARKLILVDQDEDRLHDFAFSLPCERALIVGDVADPALWQEADRVRCRERAGKFCLLCRAPDIFARPANFSGAANFSRQILPRRHAR